MRFYRVSYRTEGGNSDGFSWHTSKDQAETHARAAVENDPAEYGKGTPHFDPPEIEPIEIEATKAGILSALRMYASHASNG